MGVGGKELALQMQIGQIHGGIVHRKVEYHGPDVEMERLCRGRLDLHWTDG